MNVPTLLSELNRRDVRLWVDGNSLRCEARAGELTGGLREQLRLHKDEIMSFLRMAQAVANQQSAIVPLQPGGTGVPVFAVPGHNGDVFCYRALVQALGREQPFYGLLPPGADGIGKPLTRVEDLAAYFAEHIRRLQPSGPLIVGGFCAGGSIALEIARQLRIDREPGGFVALWGACHPTFFRPLRQFDYRVRTRLRGWWRTAHMLANKSNAERWQYLLDKLRRNKPSQEAGDDTVLAARARLEQITLAAIRSYQPSAFDGPVHLFVPSRKLARTLAGPRLWCYVASRMEIFTGPDDCTIDEMLLPPRVGTFAELFRESCRRTIASQVRPAHTLH